MSKLAQTARDIELYIRQRGWSFCFIGAVAVQRWGEIRLTQDLDLTILSGFGGELPFIQDLLKEFEPRTENPVDFALNNRVLLLKSKEGVHIDISLAAMPFEEGAIKRATMFEWIPGVNITTCSAEDLIIYKSFAGREKDWLDIQGILTRQGGNLDTQLIFNELTPLLELKEEPQALDKLRKLIEGIAK